LFAENDKFKRTITFDISDAHQIVLEAGYESLRHP